MNQNDILLKNACDFAVYNQSVNLLIYTADEKIKLEVCEKLHRILLGAYSNRYSNGDYQLFNGSKIQIVSDSDGTVFSAGDTYHYVLVIGDLTEHLPDISMCHCGEKCKAFIFNSVYEYEK